MGRHSGSPTDTLAGSGGDSERCAAAWIQTHGPRPCLSMGGFMIKTFHFFQCWESRNKQHTSMKVNNKNRALRFPSSLRNVHLVPNLQILSVAIASIFTPLRDPTGTGGDLARDTWASHVATKRCANGLRMKSLVKKNIAYIVTSIKYSRWLSFWQTWTAIRWNPWSFFPTYLS